MDKQNKEADGIEANGKMASSRSPYTDMGIILAISVFITMLVKGLIFGFTWSGIVMIVLSVAYLSTYMICRQRIKAMNFSTTAFILLSFLSVCIEFTSNKNIRPKMPVFHGAENDTVPMEDDQILFVEEPPSPAVQKTAEDSLTEIQDSTEIISDADKMRISEEHADSTTADTLL